VSHAVPASRSRTSTLALAALGVVYGDIGTSPLYAFKQAFASGHGLAVTQTHVLAALSALVWAIMLIVSIKYVWIVLSSDNEGEGGVLALMTLAQRLTHDRSRWSPWIVGGGVFAAALFYGDAIITPAISVLSAVEGISIATPKFEHWIVPITMGVLIALFLIQRHGTQRIGKLFGPITVIWFLTLAVLGIVSIAKTPSVLLALNPAYALQFAVNEPKSFFLLLSAVFLALTGGEALYADMGHFGARAIRIAWYSLVCPALVLNYFGQGALVLRDTDAARNPFFLMAPDWFIFPMVALATAATVIASQATISGAYSMTLQASRLNFLPRVRAIHTSDTERGQIYVPVVNSIMLVAVIALVAEFRSSGALAAAYGVAVSGTMLVTTALLLFVVTAKASRWRPLLLATLGIFGVLELLFFASNATKIISGGWLPLALGIVIYAMLMTWKRGTRLLAQERSHIEIPMQEFLKISRDDIPRISGTAVYLSADLAQVPNALFHNLKHYKVLHERIVFLTVRTAEIPYVGADALQLHMLAPQIYSVAVDFGFREYPDLPQALKALAPLGLQLDAMATTYFCARTVVMEGPGQMPRWQSGVFGWMMRQSESIAMYFRLPPNQIVELGTQVVL